VVPANSPLKAIADVDREGVRIAVNINSAYDLYLTRTLKAAKLVRSASGIDAFMTEKLEAVAGVKPPLAAWAKGKSELRVMDGRFMEIRQAMGTPQGRGEAGKKYLNAFVEEMKASGFVAKALQASGQGDAAIAPPTPVK